MTLTERVTQNDPKREGEKGKEVGKERKDGKRPLDRSLRSVNETSVDFTSHINDSHGFETGQSALCSNILPPWQIPSTYVPKMVEHGKNYSIQKCITDTISILNSLPGPSRGGMFSISFFFLFRM